MRIIFTRKLIIWISLITALVVPLVGTTKPGIRIEPMSEPFSTIENRDGQRYITGARDQKDFVTYALSELKIESGDRLEFENDFSRNDFKSVITYVTGLNGAAIYGILDSATQFPQASLHVVAPGGVIVGQNAHFLVGDQLQISTANVIESQTGFIEDLSLVFSDESPATINFITEETIDDTQAPPYTVADSNVYLLSKNIVFNDGTLSVEGGNLYLITDSQNTSPESDLPNNITELNGGQIKITNGSRVEADFNTTAEPQKPEELREHGGAIHLYSRDIIIGGYPEDSRASTSSIASTSGSKATGGVYIEAAGTLTLEDRSRVSSKFGDEAKPKDQAPLTLIGNNGVNLNGWIDISTSVSGALQLRANDISVESPNGSISINGSSIDKGVKLTAGASGLGNTAGNLSLTAKNDISLTNAKLRSSTHGFAKDEVNGVQSGKIDIVANTVTVESSTIESNNSGDAEGGDITISANRSVTIKGHPTSSDGKDDGRKSINASTAGRGDGGDITLNAPKVTIQSGSKIVSESTNEDNIDSDELGQPGDITINSGSMDIKGAGTRLSLSSSGTNAGSVSLNVNSVLYIGENATIETEVTADQGNGGNIRLRGNTESSLLIYDITSKLNASTHNGEGGLVIFDNISVVPNGRISESIDISANGTEGLEGDIHFSKPIIQSVSGTEQLGDSILDPSALTSRRCHDAPSGRSNFYINDREGVQSAPNELISSRSSSKGYPASAFGPKPKRSILHNRKPVDEPVFFACSR